MKPVYWLGDSRKAMRGFAAKARAVAGYELYRVQIGRDPTDWKPMKPVGVGVREIRVHVDGEWRVMYLATRVEAVYVLHAFGKKSGRTPAADIEVARARLKQIDAARPK